MIYVRSRSKPSFWYLLLFCDIYKPQQKKQTISFHFTLNIIFTYFYMKFPTSHQELQFLLYFYKLHPTARSHFQMRQGECQDTFPCLTNTMQRLVREFASTQGIKKSPIQISDLWQVNFSIRQVTFQVHFVDGWRPKQFILKLKNKLRRAVKIWVLLGQRTI